MSEHINKKKISKIENILDIDKNTNGQFMIFYMTGQDCGSCISKGFQLIKDNQNKIPIKIYPVASNSNIGNLQVYYDYENTIFPDNQDLIRKSLGYFHSPMFLVYSMSKGVLNAYFIPTYDDGDNAQKFFDQSLQTLFLNPE